MQIVEIIRKLQRPIISISLIGIIGYLGIDLINKFGDADMAKSIIAFILGSGATIIGVLFGERAAKSKEKEGG